MGQRQSFKSISISCLLAYKCLFVQIIPQTVQEIGKEKFAAMCSDSTGNTKKGHKIIHEEVQTIIDLGDCCHHIHNTIKDINRLLELREVSPVCSAHICHLKLAAIILDGFLSSSDGGVLQ